MAEDAESSQGRTQGWEWEMLVGSALPLPSPPRPPPPGVEDLQELAVGGEGGALQGPQEEAAWLQESHGWPPFLGTYRGLLRGPFRAYPVGPGAGSLQPSGRKAACFGLLPAQSCAVSFRLAVVK